MANVLPEYEKPPLNEVVIGVQFQPLHNLHVGHFGLFWSRIRARYPFTEDQPPLAHLVERPEVVPTAPVSIQVVGIPLPRCWFLDQSGNELIQLQQDRLLRNWRQLGGSETYPRYAKLSQAFWQEWDEFAAFVSDESVGELVPDQCELTYVNHFEPGPDWEGLSKLESLFSLFRSPTSGMPRPELFGWNARFKLPEGCGALHVSVDPTFRGRDFRLILAMNLTARGAPASKSKNDVAAWFDLAHEMIVRTFDQLTNPAMHAIWGKKQ